MVFPLRLWSKTIVSPLWAAAMAAGSEPAPLSRLLVTVRMLGIQRSSRASNRGRKVDRLREGGCTRRRSATPDRFAFRIKEENHITFSFLEGERGVFNAPVTGVMTDPA